MKAEPYSYEPFELDELVVTRATPAALHAVWPQILSDLEHCLVQDPDGYWPEDVYAQVQQERLGLYVGSVRESYVGFVILQTRAEAGGGARLHLLYVNGPGFLQQGNDWIIKLARELHCQRVTFRASNLAIGRLARPLGYHPVAVEYEKRI